MFSLNLTVVHIGNILIKAEGQQFISDKDHCPWTTKLEIQRRKLTNFKNYILVFSTTGVSSALTFYIFLDKISSWVILQLSKVTGVIQEHSMSEK